jgi:hypothetical protein
MIIFPKTTINVVRRKVLFHSFQSIINVQLNRKLPFFLHSVSYNVILCFLETGDEDRAYGLMHQSMHYTIELPPGPVICFG